MFSSSEISSEKRAGAERHRSTLGNGSRRTRHRIEGCIKMAQRSINLRETHVVPTTYVVPENEHEAALEFAAVVIPFSRGELARAGKRGKDAAKRWKEGSALPSAWTMMHLARQIPSVRAWMAGKMGMNSQEFMSPQVLTAAMASLYQVAHQPGPDGDAVRLLLSKMGKREG